MATIPSIAMIPSGVKASKLYSVLPTDGTGDFTTTRASVATRVNESGLIEEVAANVPRLDYSDGTCPSLLLEGTATNIIPYSEDFSNASWTKTNLSITSNSVISPSGVLNSSKLTPNTTNTQHKIDITKTVTSGATVSLSAFVKKGEYNFCCLYEVTSAKGRFFDISNGTQGGIFVGEPSTSNIESYGNDWYKISITTTVPLASARYILYVSDTISTVTFVGDNTKGIYTWGAQLEQGSYATSYIPTQGTAQTRVADTASGSGNSTVINSSEGTLYAEISALANDGTYRMISLSNGTSVERIYMQYTNASNTISVVVKNGSVTQANIGYTLSDETEFSKIGFKYKENDFALWVNGVEVGTDTSGLTPIGLSELSFDNGSGGNNFFGNTKDLRVYNTALSDAELAILTTI